MLYLHSHSGCRLEGLQLIHHVFPDFDLCLFDFNGCGISEGEYVSLGLGESEDAVKIMDEIHSRYGTTNFLLWGRSMGAVTAMHIARMCEIDGSLKPNMIQTYFIPEIQRLKKGG